MTDKEYALSTTYQRIIDVLNITNSIQKNIEFVDPDMFYDFNHINKKLQKILVSMVEKFKIE